MIQSAPRDSNLIDRLLHTLMLALFSVTVLIFLAAPVLALSWRNQPFAGFIVGSSLVVNGISASDWPGANAGIAFPQKIERIAGQHVVTPGDINRVLAAHQIGDTISVFTGSPEGEQYLYPNIPLIAFPAADMVRIFWIPYLVGAVYLGIGLWIYQMRGKSRSGRTLALFCIFTAIICGLLFDIYTTHLSDILWILIMGNVGGTLIGLALRFPEEWLPIHNRTWLPPIPYAISLALGIWGAASVYAQVNPWAYVPALNASYRYAAVSMLVFLLVMIYRARKGTTVITRQQARLVLAGSLIAFVPISVWLLAPLSGRYLNFNPMLFLPPLLVFPVSISLAILRFRLWDMDSLVNRAFVYGAATAILAGVFAALINLSQRMFVAFTGEKSDAAIVLSTLFIAAIFTPMRTRVQSFVDRHLREEADHMQDLRDFGAEVQAFVQMSDVGQISKRLLAEAVQSLGAEAGTIRLILDEQLLLTHTVGLWKNDARLSVALEYAGRRYGLLQLGAHRMNRPYTQAEGQMLHAVAAQVAVAIQFALPHQDPGLSTGASVTGAASGAIPESRSDSKANGKPAYFDKDTRQLKDSTSA